MSMTKDERQWLEERFRRLEDRVREDARAMESRLTMQIVDLREITEKRLDDHSKRIRALELWRSWIAGLSAAAGAAGSWIVQVFKEGRSP